MMCEKYLLFLLPFIYFCCNAEDTRAILPAIIPEIYMSVPDMINHLGYLVQSHNVTTDDQYILGIHRIPSSKNGDAPSQTYPVLLAHGLICSSAEFTNGLPTQSLAYMLADARFDVWMINFRGNFYSRNHLNLTPNNSQFWEFSWNELGNEDLRSVIDYILIQTGRKQIYIVSHSLGSLSTFSLLSTNVSYNDKVKMHVTLGPVANFTDYGALFSTFTNNAFKMGIRDLLPLGPIQKTVGGTICNGATSIICEMVLNLFTGDQPFTLDSDRFPVFLSNFPAGSSIYVLLNMVQNSAQNRFMAYDWGKKGNKQRYGQETPREYNISKITCPTHIFHTINDRLARQKEIDIISKDMKSIVGIHRVGDSRDGHMSLVWASNISPTINKMIIQILQNETDLRKT